MIWTSDTVFVCVARSSGGCVNASIVMLLGMSSGGQDAPTRDCAQDYTTLESAAEINKHLPQRS